MVNAAEERLGIVVDINGVWRMGSSGIHPGRALVELKAYSWFGIDSVLTAAGMSSQWFTVFVRCFSPGVVSGGCCGIRVVYQERWTTRNIFLSGTRR